VGIIRGGDRTNVVPDYAYFDMDVRTADQASLMALEAAMRQVTYQNKLQGTRITLSGSMLCQPFECNKRNAHLVELAKEAGSELGLKIQDAGSGGASDANTTSAMGVPTLDGLGAGGGLAHNPGEFVELDYLPVRVALVMGVVRRIGGEGGRDPFQTERSQAVTFTEVKDALFRDYVQGDNRSYSSTCQFHVSLSLLIVTAWSVCNYH
jgi:glutamate carboxypeptidase